MRIQSYQNLLVWEKSIDLTVEVYKLSKNLPKDEMFGLISQMRRAAISIGSNIAEGYGRRSDRQLFRFLLIARGSALELESQLITIRRLKMLDDSEIVVCASLLVDTLKLIQAFINKLKI